MHHIVQDYRNLLDELPAKIKKSTFKPKAFIKMLNIPSATFYKRMSHRNFTIEEAEKIVKILEMEKNLEESLQAGFDEIQSGKVVSAQEVATSLQKKLQE